MSAEKIRSLIELVKSGQNSSKLCCSIAHGKDIALFFSLLYSNFVEAPLPVCGSDNQVFFIFI